MNSSTDCLPKKLPINQPTLVQAFQGLLDSGDNSDVTFKVKDKDIQAHKLILGIRSQRLREMLQNLSANESPPPINDCTPADFKCFLTFLYTDDCCITIQNVEQVFMLAKKWDVQALIQKCMTFMEKQIDESNILRYAKIAFSYGNGDDGQCDLYKECLLKLPEMLPDINFMICEDSKWIPLSYDLLFDIIKNLKCNPQLEETLFYKIIDWSKKECDSREIDPTPDNIKDVLDEIPIYINYDMLSLRTLATVVYQNQLLPCEELLDCYCKFFIEEKENA